MKRPAVRRWADVVQSLTRQGPPPRQRAQHRTTSSHGVGSSDISRTPDDTAPVPPEADPPLAEAGLEPDLEPYLDDADDADDDSTIDVLIQQLRDFGDRLDELASVSTLRDLVAEGLTSHAERTAATARDTTEAFEEHRRATDDTITELRNDLAESDARVRHAAVRLEAIAVDVTTLLKATLERETEDAPVVLDAVTRLERCLASLDERITAPADDSRVQSLVDAVARLEQQVAAIDARLTVAPVDDDAEERRLQPLLDAVARLEARVASVDDGSAAAPVDADAEERRLLPVVVGVARLEQQLAAMADRAAAPPEDVRVQWIFETVARLERQLGEVDERLSVPPDDDVDDDDERRLQHVLDGLARLEERLSAAVPDDEPVHERLDRIEARVVAAPNDQRVLDAVSSLDERLASIDGALRAQREEIPEYGNTLLHGLRALHDVVTQLAVVTSGAPTAADLAAMTEAVDELRDRARSVTEPVSELRDVAGALGAIDRSIGEVRTLVEAVVDTIPASADGSAADISARVADAVVAKLHQPTPAPKKTAAPAKPRGGAAKRT